MRNPQDRPNQSEDTREGAQSDLKNDIDGEQNDAITSHLRRAFEATTEEKIPDDMLQLLHRLSQTKPS